MSDTAMIWLTAQNVRVGPSNRKQEIASALPVKTATLQHKSDPYIVVSDNDDRCTSMCSIEMSK